MKHEDIELEDQAVPSYNNQQAEALCNTFQLRVWQLVVGFQVRLDLIWIRSFKLDLARVAIIHQKLYG